MLLFSKGSPKTIHHRYLEIKGNIKSLNLFFSIDSRGSSEEEWLVLNHSSSY